MKLSVFQTKQLKFIINVNNKIYTRTSSQNDLYDTSKNELIKEKNTSKNELIKEKF
jgi:hypothetical protein